MIIPIKGEFQIAPIIIWIELLPKVPGTQPLAAVSRAPTLP